jgi:hypothetical protein
MKRPVPGLNGPRKFSSQKSLSPLRVYFNFFIRPGRKRAVSPDFFTTGGAFIYRRSLFSASVVGAIHEALLRARAVPDDVGKRGIHKEHFGGARNGGQKGLKVFPIVTITC